MPWKATLLLPSVECREINAAGARTGASLHVNGIDPGWANDVLPLTTSSLCQRIDEVRVMEIADYSTYYQPVVMKDLFGFGEPLDAKPLLWEPGILTTAWGPVVRVIAEGLGVRLDEPLVEEVDRRPAPRPTRLRFGAPAARRSRSPPKACAFPGDQRRKRRRFAGYRRAASPQRTGRLAGAGLHPRADGRLGRRQSHGPWNDDGGGCGSHHAVPRPAAEPDTRAKGDGGSFRPISVQWRERGGWHQGHTCRSRRPRPRHRRSRPTP